MTLPNNVQLPLDPELIKSGDPKDLYDFLKKFTYVLGNYMQQMNFSANGLTRLIEPSIPPDPPYEFIQGSAVGGVGTYINTSMWSRRQDLMNQNWFDITWTAHTGAGNLLIQLPYFAQNSSNRPYVCVIENNGLVFTAGYTYLVGNLIPNTNTIEVRQCGSGLPSIPIALPAASSLRGSILYAGQQDK